MPIFFEEAPERLTTKLLTAKAVEKHFPESEETQKGHMRSVKAGIRSTKKETMKGTDKDAVDRSNMEGKTK